MEDVLGYAMKSVLCSGILCAYYWLFLRNKRLHAFNRYYLLAAAPVSLVLPLLHFRLPGAMLPPQATAYQLLEVVHGSGVEEVPVMTTTPLLTWQTALAVVYGAAVLFLAARLTAQIVWVCRLRNKGSRSPQAGYALVYIRHSKAPFSFLHFLFWKEGLDMASEEGKRILAHELVHIRQWHTLDKLLIQIVLVCCWFNPFYWLLQKEMGLVHEFMADEAAIEDRDTATFARMLLQGYGGNAYPDIVLPFFHSSIKRRLLMLQQSTKPRLSAIRRLMVLPLLAAALILFSFRPGDITGTRARKTITLALDAGHGGNDDGAIGVNGIKEKDLALKVTNRLAQLGETYNVRVITLRPDDNYVALQDRSAKANASGADVLVSIHLNAAPKSRPVQDRPHGMEIMVGKQNSRNAESRKLASAVAGQFTALQLPAQLVDMGSALLRTASIPAILIECGYVEQAEDVERITDSRQLDQLCDAILSGLVHYQNSREQ